MQMSNKIYFSLFISLCLVLQLHAQNDSTYLSESEKEIIKNFEAQLEDAQIKEIEIDVLSASIDRTALEQYQLSNIPIQSEQDLDLDLRPLAYDEPPVENTYANYVRLAAGAPNHLDFLGNLNYAWDQVSVGITGNYFHIQDKRNAYLRDRQLGIKSTFKWQFSDAAELYGKLGYGNEKHHFNSLDTNIERTNDLFRHYYTIKASAGIKNIETSDADIDYDVQFNANYLDDNYDNRTLGAGINGMVQKRLSDTWSFDLLGSFQHERFRSDTNTINSDLYMFQPMAAYQADQWSIKFGVNLGNLTGHNFLVQPTVQAYYAINEQNEIRLFMNSRAQQNTYQKLIDYNWHYIPALQDISISNVYSFGAEWHYEQADFEAAVNASYDILNNQLVYLDAPADVLYFQQGIDDGNRIHVGVKAQYLWLENSTFQLDVNQDIYKLENYEHAYGTPTTAISFGLDYGELLEEKLVLGINLHYQAGLWAQNAYTAVDKQLDGTFQLDLHGAYEINNTFKAFVELNNLTNNQNDRWYGYNNYGINPKLGVTAKF